MKRVLFAATILAAGWAFAPFAAKADGITLLPVGDPLHGAVCSGSGTGCNATEVGGVVPGNFGTTGSSFGFMSTPAGAGGTLTIAVLIPTNEIGTIPLLPTITGSLVGGGGVLTAVSGVFSASSPDLVNFIFGASANGSPSNPFSAFQTPEQAFDPGLTGFDVFTVTAGPFVTPPGFTGTSATTLDDFFSLNGGTLAGLLPTGSVITGFLQQSDGTFISTAPSGQLSEQFSTVPGPIVGAGLPGLVSALIGMVGLSRYRKRRKLA